MRTDTFDILMIVILFINFALLSSSRILACISLLAFQGVVLSFVPLMHSFDLVSIVFFAVIIFLKVFFFPAMLRRALRSVVAKKELDPIVDYTASILIGLAVLFFLFIFFRYANFNRKILSVLGVTTAGFTIFTGLFLMCARRKAITQVVAYVIFENGIYLLGVSLMVEQGLLVELGIILDVLGFVLIAGIVTFHINRTFDHIDTDNLFKAESEVKK